MMLEINMMMLMRRMMMMMGFRCETVFLTLSSPQHQLMHCPLQKVCALYPCLCNTKNCTLIHAVLYFTKRLRPLYAGLCYILCMCKFHYPALYTPVFASVIPQCYVLYKRPSFIAPVFALQCTFCMQYQCATKKVQCVSECSAMRIGM